MSSRRRTAARPAPVALLILALAAGALTIPPAAATTVTTNCAGLQAAFTNSDPNDVVVLTEMCTGMDFELPQHRIVFRGKPGAGLDGTGATDTLLLGGMNNGTTVIRDLIFRDAPFGALDLGAAPQIINNRFFNNDWPGANGGAVSVDQDTPMGIGIVIRGNIFGGTTPASGNTADVSGAVYASSAHAITVEDNVFRNNSGGSGAALGASAQGTASITISRNTFEDNSSPNSGGALHLNTAGTTRLTNNTFRGNQAGPNDLGAYGGALYVSMANVTESTLIQSGNLFIDNRVLGAQPDDRNSGGAEYIINPNDATIRMTNERFVRNAVTGEAGVGGGLYVRQGDLIGLVDVTLTNTVVAGNSVGINSQGGGIYAEENCGGINCETNWTLKNTTVAGNTGGTGSAGIQMHGDTENPLVAHNSIIYGNGMPNEVTGFETMTFSHSDVCGMGGAPLPGAGNICKAPKLGNAAAGNVHQTAKSPTRDKGSNALVPAGLSRDYEGDARIIDTNKDGSKRVDMGADERRAKPSISIGISRGSVIVSGAVRPNNRGKRVAVTLSRMSNGRFRSLATKRDRLNRRSRYSVRFADPSSGTCRVKVVFPGSLTTFPGTKTKRFSC